MMAGQTTKGCGHVASIELIGPTGDHKTANTRTMLVSLIYNRGYVPVTGTIAEAFAQVYTPPPPPETNPYLRKNELLALLADLFVSTSKLVLSPTAPANPTPGTVWINTTP